MDMLIKKLTEKSKVSQLNLRRQDKNKKTSNSTGLKFKNSLFNEFFFPVRYIVSASGTFESTQQLRKLVTVTSPIKNHWEGQDLAQQMANFCYLKIMKDDL